MTDTQILTLVIGITFPVLGIIGALVAAIHANKRIDEAVLSANKRVDDTKHELTQRFDDMKAELIRHMDNGFEHMELLLKLHEAEHHKP